MSLAAGALLETARPPAWNSPRGDFVEPDWRRLPGYRDVSKEQWESSVWQLAHAVKNVRQLKDVFGSYLPDVLAADIELDQQQFATMPLLAPPQMLNTMDERDLWQDPVRSYMLPARSDREPEWASHPMASRDSLHEADMWAVEGLTHRYPTKVLAELLSTCPQYCGHCTRMDLVGNSTPTIAKYKFEIKQPDRHRMMLDYIAANPVIRDVRLATKALMGLPQHFLQDEVLAGMERLAVKARKRGVSLAVHTHVNHASQVTPLVAKATGALLDMGFRDVRNQGVLLRGVNTTAKDLLELCFTLLDHARVMPHY